MTIPVHELKDWFSFTRILGFGRVRFNQMLRHFSVLSKACKASSDELSKSGLDERGVNSLTPLRAGTEPDRELEHLVRYHVRPIPFADDDYPPQLREQYDSPPVIFTRGAASASIKNGIAVVGTKLISDYGRQVTEDIVDELSRNGLTIVSGLARGIDTAAHKETLESGGVTIAVCASGLDIVYPAEHARLVEAIMERGVLVSEHPLGVQPKAEYFPLRNRIMSGLCLGVPVIEAGESNGALITAHQAIDQDREVFTVPGSIYAPSSRSTNRLIQKSESKLVLTASDILDEPGMDRGSQQLSLVVNELSAGTESTVFGLLGKEPIRLDEICRRGGLSAQPLPVS